MDKSIIRRIIIALLSVLLLVYVIYLLSNASFKNIRTESATYSTMTESLDVDGYFIRSETIMNSKNIGGVISYKMEDTDKVSKGEKVAEVYNSAEDAQKQAELQSLEQQLAVLKELESSAENLSVTPDVIDENISTYLIDMAINKNDGNLSKSDESIDQIIYNINERQVLTGKVKDFSEKISELESKIDKMKSSSSKKILDLTAPVAGYFTSELDGYENVLNIKNIDSIMPEDLNKAKNSSKKTYDNAVGKVVSDVFWYVACPVTSEQAIKLNEYKDNQMTLTMQSASLKNINVTLVSINRKDSKSDGIAIFRGTDMNENLLSVRSGTIAINMNSYTGISVPESAIHQDTITITTEDKNGKEKEVSKKVSGVYVQYGNEINFKEVVPLYSDSGFVICKQEPDDDELFSGSTIKVYDKVVVEGVDLYDGKVIN